jgi:hypothetical protein
LTLDCLVYPHGPDLSLLQQVVSYPDRFATGVPRVEQQWPQYAASDLTSKISHLQAQQLQMFEQETSYVMSPEATWERSAIAHSACVVPSLRPLSSEAQEQRRRSVDLMAGPQWYQATAPFPQYAPQPAAPDRTVVDGRRASHGGAAGGAGAGGGSRRPSASQAASASGLSACHLVGCRPETWGVTGLQTLGPSAPYMMTADAAPQDASRLGSVAANGEYVAVIPVTEMGLGLFLKDENGVVVIGGFRSSRSGSGVNPSQRAGVRKDALGDNPGFLRRGWQG